MGFFEFFEDLLDTVFSLDSKKQEQPKEDKKKTVQATATTSTGKKKEAEIATPIPEITAITWINKAGSKIDKAKYGKEIFLLIETEYANGCWVFVFVNCDDWEKPLRKLVKIDRPTKVSQYTKISFTPLLEWNKDKSLEEVKPQAETWVIWQQFRNDIELKQCASNDFDLEELDFHLRGEKRGFYYRNFMFIKHNEKSLKSTEISLSKIVIVIDPGHGYKDSHQGTQCRGFQYYEKDANGEPDMTKIKKAKASDLPPHVLADIEKWIVKWVDIPTSEKEQEWYYVIQVSLNLKEELEQEKIYKVIFTREKIDEQIGQIKASDNFFNRRKVGNDNNADYFLSIHCDGQGDKNTAHLGYKHTGFFVILPRDVDTNSQGEDLKLSKMLGEDIVKYYNVLNHDKNPIWIANGEKGVLTKNNKVRRRLIIELGRMTNPLDIIKLYEAGTQKKIAKQLKDGIVYNIEKRYEDS